MIPLVPLNRQFQSIKTDIVLAISQIIDSGQYIMGPSLVELEQKICKHLNVSHAIGVANGTDALVLTLEAFGIGTGDEVITTPFTFFATAEAISRVGATPVFVDIDPHTYNIDMTKIEDKITAKTKAILPVHIFGQPANMAEIVSLAKQYDLYVIEDACQAFGATYRGQYAGSIGDAACFSFFPTKNLGTMGDGGLITTNHAEVAERLKLLRHHGSRRKYYHDILGYNSRLDEIHAAILLISLEKIDEWNELRRQKAAYYREQLKNMNDVTVQEELPDRTHIYHLFCIEATHRDSLMKHLLDKDIQCGVYYPCPLHLQRVYANLSYKEGDFPVSEEASRRLLAIPMSPFITTEEQDAVIAAIREATTP